MLKSYEFEKIEKGDLLEVNGDLLIATSDVYSHFDNLAINLADIVDDEEGNPHPKDEGTMYLYRDLKNHTIKC